MYRPMMPLIRCGMWVEIFWVQSAPDIIRMYCEDWGLDINVSKTSYIFTWEDKITAFFFLFSFSFLLLQDESVEAVWNYKYLRVRFNYNDKFLKAQKPQLSLANVAVFLTLWKYRQLNLPLDIPPEPFRKMCATDIFAWLWNNVIGLRKHGCSLKTAAWSFEVNPFTAMSLENDQ